jgi:dienelactone hydrolase
MIARMTRGRRRLLIAAAPLVAIAAVAATIGDEYARGASFVIRAAGMQGTVRSLAAWQTSRVSERDITIPWRHGALRARIYEGEEPGSAPPSLLVPGVHAGGIDEPRLVQFARDIAALGRTVVSAELPDLKQYRITPRSTDMIEDAASWLSSTTPGGRVGMMGISFAGGLSVVAAGRQSLRDRIAFVMSFGGHGDLPRTLRYLCTGELRGGASRPPHDYGVAIILLGVADRVVPAEQADALQEAIRAFLHASHVDMVDKARGREAFERARRMAAGLPEPARTLMGYVNDRDVARLGPILLPHTEALGADPALSPSRSERPSAPVYLLHGTDDNVIPADESAMLGAHLQGAGVQVRVLLTPLITHAEVDRSSAARAVWDLVRFWTGVLDEE